MLHDRDRIFTNLYGQDDWGLEGARRRGVWDGTKKLLELGRDAIVQGPWMHEADDRARHHVLAGGQDAGHVVHGLERAPIRGSGVDRAIGIEFEQRIRIVAGVDADRRQAAETSLRS